MLPLWGRLSSLPFQDWQAGKPAPQLSENVMGLAEGEGFEPPDLLGQRFSRPPP